MRLVQRSICPRPSRSGSGWRARPHRRQRPFSPWTTPWLDPLDPGSPFPARAARLALLPSLLESAGLALPHSLLECAALLSDAFSSFRAVSSLCPAPRVLIPGTLGTGGLEGTLAIWTFGASPRPRVTGTLGTRGLWQFGPTATANRIKSSVNVPSGRAVVRAQRAIPRQCGLATRHDEVAVHSGSACTRG